jgi:hypothetical protein
MECGEADGGEFDRQRYPGLRSGALESRGGVLHAGRKGREDQVEGHFLWALTENTKHQFEMMEAMSKLQDR